jgi:hypothetical protein
MAVMPMNTSQDQLAQRVLGDLPTIVEPVLTELVLPALEKEPLIPKLVPLAPEEPATLVAPVNTRLELLALELELLTPKPVPLALVVPAILVELVLTRLELLAPELELLTPKPVPIVLVEEQLMLAQLVLTRPVLPALELEPLIPKLVPLAPVELPTLVPLVPTNLELLALELELPTHKLVHFASTEELPILVPLVRLKLVPLVLELDSLIPKPAVVMLFLVMVCVLWINVVSITFVLESVSCISLLNGWLPEMLIPMSQPQMVIPSATPTEDLTQEPIMESWTLMIHQALDPKTCTGLQLAILLQEFTTCVSSLTMAQPYPVKPLRTI